MLGLIGVLLALGLLIFLAYRGFSVLYLAPITALVAVAFAGLPLVATYTQIFMPAVGKYIITYFPVFALGALFGKLMSDTGFAKAIALWIVNIIGEKRAILATILSGAILTYGGVSVFVVSFALFPIANQMFRAADIPKRLVAASMLAGAGTFTMTALPGTPAIQNAIPGPFFGTNAFAAPVFGIVCGLLMFALASVWLGWRAKKLMAAGEGYQDSNTRPGFGETNQDEQNNGDTGSSSGATTSAVTQKPPNAMLGLVPILIVIVTNFSLVTWVFPAMDFAYLQEETYGKTDISKVGGIWAIVIALFFACLFTLAVGWRHMKDAKESLNQGATGSMLPIFNTASEVGFGAIIASVPAFSIVRDAVLSIPGNPLISLAVAINVLAGITGSASGGMSIGLETLGADYLALAQQAGISPEIMHRVAAIASGGMDSLPHNGAVITLLTICGLTHRQSYADVGVVSVVIPIISLAVVLGFTLVFGLV